MTLKVHLNPPAPSQMSHRNLVTIFGFRSVNCRLRRLLLKIMEIIFDHTNLYSIVLLDMFIKIMIINIRYMLSNYIYLCI